MEQYIKKSDIVSEIERLYKKWEMGNYVHEKLISFLNALEVKDPYEQCVQYDSIEAGIQAHAETYSFNIESQLFPQLTKEQQALWRKEIEQACISGGNAGIELSRDQRYKENLEVKEVHDIWHDVSEKPELEQPLLIVMNGTHKDFRRHYRIGCYGKRANDIPTWVIDSCWSDSFISKWCYISDILKQTLEVKEVDFEKEFFDWYHEEKNRDYNASVLYERYDIISKKLAKYFFELGLKAKEE